MMLYLLLSYIAGFVTVWLFTFWVSYKAKSYVTIGDCAVITIISCFSWIGLLLITGLWFYVHVYRKYEDKVIFGKKGFEKKE